jgi:hypothetical protein
MAIDQGVKNLCSAIAKQESGSDYSAKGGSGEHGAYQFMPDTWSSWAGQYLGDKNAPLTVENQNKVAYSKVSELKNKGYNPAQIASIWNSGSPNWQGKVGVNKFGVKYDTPSYVRGVSQYFKQLSAKPITPTPPKETLGEKVLGGVEKVGDFLGVGTLGKAIGGTIAGATGANKMSSEAQTEFTDADQKLAAMLNDPKVSDQQKAHIRLQLEQDKKVAPTLGAEQTNPAINLTPEQIAGSAAETALLTAPIGVGKAAEGAGLGEKIARGAAGGLLTGAGLAAGRGMEEKQSAGGVAKSALLGGAIGAPLGAAGELVAAGLSKVGEELPGKLAGTAVKETPMKTAARIARDQPLLGEELIAHGHAGTNTQLNEIATKGLENTENSLQEMLKSVPSTVTIKKTDLLLYMENLIKTKEATPGMVSEVEKVWQTVNDIPKDELTLPEANQIKRNLYNSLNDRAYSLDPTLATKREAQKVLANALKTEIENKSEPYVGNGVIKAQNQELAYYGRLNKATLSNMGREASKGIGGVGDIATMGAGALYKGVPGAAVAEVSRKLLGSSFAKTWGAVLVNRVANAIASIAPEASDTVIQQLQKLPVSTIQKMSDAALKNEIKNLIVPEQKQGTNTNK